MKLCSYMFILTVAITITYLKYTTPLQNRSQPPFTGRPRWTISMICHSTVRTQDDAYLGTILHSKETDAITKSIFSWVQYTTATSKYYSRISGAKGLPRCPLSHGWLPRSALMGKTVPPVVPNTGTLNDIGRTSERHQHEEQLEENQETASELHLDSTRDTFRMWGSGDASSNL